MQVATDASAILSWRGLEKSAGSDERRRISGRTVSAGKWRSKKDRSFLQISVSKLLIVYVHELHKGPERICLVSSSLSLQSSLIQTDDPIGSTQCSLRKETRMRRMIVLTLTLALCLCGSAIAGQSRYRNTPIRPRPAPPEQQINLPPSAITLRAPETARVAVVVDEPKAVAPPVAEPTVAAEPAAPTPVPAQATQQPVPTQIRQQPARQTYRPAQQQRQGFFGRMMQVERRKNAWIRRTFFK
jgi:hypothetical protein